MQDLTEARIAINQVMIDHNIQGGDCARVLLQQLAQVLVAGTDSPLKASEMTSYCDVELCRYVAQAIAQKY